MQQTVSNLKIKKQGGYTLVELAIAVAILAVLIVAGLTGVQGILNSSKVNDQIKTVSKMSSKVNALFASTGASGTAGVTTANMVALGAWDASKLQANLPKSSFSTNEYAKANSAAIGNMPIGGGIVYTIANVPSALCADVINGANNVTYAISVQAAAANAENNAPTTLAGTVAKAADATLAPTSLATGCGLGTNVDLIFALKP